MTTSMSLEFHDLPFANLGRHGGDRYKSTETALSPQFGKFRNRMLTCSAWPFNAIPQIGPGLRNCLSNAAFPVYSPRCHNRRARTSLTYEQNRSKRCLSSVRCGKAASNANSLRRSEKR